MFFSFSAWSFRFSLFCVLALPGWPLPNRVSGQEEVRRAGQLQTQHSQPRLWKVSLNHFVISMMPTNPYIPPYVNLVVSLLVCEYPIHPFIHLFFHSLKMNIYYRSVIRFQNVRVQRCHPSGQRSQDQSDGLRSAEPRRLDRRDQDRPGAEAAVALPCQLRFAQDLLQVSRCIPLQKWFFPSPPLPSPPPLPLPPPIPPWHGYSNGLWPHSRGYFTELVLQIQREYHGKITRRKWLFFCRAVTSILSQRLLHKMTNSRQVS